MFCTYQLDRVTTYHRSTLYSYSENQVLNWKEHLFKSFFKNTSLTHTFSNAHYVTNALTHWGRVTYICVGKLTTIGSDNGLSPGRRQAIIWTNAGILLIGPLGTNFSEILIGIQTFSFKKMHLKMSSGKRRPSCLDLNVLNADDMSSSMFIVFRGHDTEAGKLFFRWNVHHWLHGKFLKWQPLVQAVMKILSK